MQSMNVNGMQVIVLNQQALPNEQLTSRVMTPRLAKQLVGLGVVHILIGVFCIIFQIISVVNGSISRNEFLPSGHGFWSGLTFLVTGIIGITAGIRKSNCQVVAFTILSIISAVLTLALISLAAVSVVLAVYPRNYESDTFYHERMTILIMESMLCAMGMLEGIIATWSSIVCCVIGVCCCRRASPPQTQPNGPPYSHNNFMSATTVEGSYTGLNTGMIRNLPSADMAASAYITTSVYEEIHDYLDVVE